MCENNLAITKSSAGVEMSARVYHAHLLGKYNQVGFTILSPPHIMEKVVQICAVPLRAQCLSESKTTLKEDVQKPCATEIFPHIFQFHYYY